ncbi:MAG TPA: lysylphosphatidylglycerol synthase transmembrane domain-containing protein [Pyrinomonadaceae bacterium]|nr:lysylphosphatidylglycerol synthase transmembrane domain-containing protein [Pyrinomonadaceae bacterium]
MNRKDQQRSSTRRFTPLGIIFASLGLLLFIYFVRKAGVEEIIEGIRRLGAGFLLIFVISGTRKVVRSVAWMRCLEAPSRLRFRDAFKAVVIGDAVGTLMPVGTVVSEPAKAALVRDRVPLMAGLSAITVEYLFYSLSVALFIFSGTVALLLSFPLPKPLRLASIGALIVIVLIVLAAYLIIRRQWKIFSRLLDFFHGRNIGRRFLQTRRESVSTLEERIYGFYGRHRSRFLPILLLESCYHLAGVAEAYVTLSYISEALAPTVLTAFILESVNRIINIVFKLIPLRTGIDEAGTGLLANVLGLGTTLGVTLAIIRKAREICWTALGIALLVRRGLSLRTVAEEAEAALAKEVSAARSTTVPASEGR